MSAADAMSIVNELASLDWERDKCRGSVNLTPAEVDIFASFSCWKVNCSKPADRAYVLSAIRESWGSEDIFDTYVQETLPTIMARSKKEFYKQTSTVMSKVFDLSFGGA